MNKLATKLFLLLALSALLFALPLTASAADSGTCGDSLTWTLDDEGVLTISGTGEMSNYMYSYPASTSPWGTDVVSVVIEEGVTSIGEYAFYECGKLASVTLPDSLTSIGENAFYRCLKIPGIMLPDSITFVGSNALSMSSAFRYADMNSLTALTLSKDSSFMDPDYPGLYLKVSVDSESGSRTFSIAECVSDATEIVIPDVVTTIRAYLFDGKTNLTSVTLPSALTEIGSYAFRGCTGLTSITIPDGLTTLAGNAFRDCPATLYAKVDSVAALTISDKNLNFTTPEYDALSLSVRDTGDGLIYTVESCRKDVTEVVVPEFVTIIDSYAFSNCTSLTSITLPETLTTVNSGAFSGCTSLTRVTLPEMLEDIPDRLFYNCTGLTYVMLPGNLRGIGYEAFYNCPIDWVFDRFGPYPVLLSSAGYSFTDPEYPDLKLMAYELSGGGLRFTVVDCKEDVTSVTFPEGVTAIGSHAFSGCSGLTSIPLPETLTSISSYAFSRCSGLTSISLPETLTGIGDSAFFGCTGLTSIELPDDITGIYKKHANGGSFYNCSAAIYASVDSRTAVAMTTAGYSFIDPEYPGLEFQVTEEDGVRTVTLTGFEAGMESITVPDFVDAVDAAAFTDFTGTICASAASDAALALTTAKLPFVCAECPELTISVTEDKNGVRTVTITDCAADAETIVIPEGVTKVSAAAFADCVSLKSVTFPETVTSVNSNAFTNCPAKRYAAFNGTAALALGYVGYTTPDCPALTLQTSKNYDDSLSTSVVDCAEDATEVVIPEGVTSVGDSAFNDCTSLKSITFPDDLTEVNYGAFTGCPAARYASLDSAAALALSAGYSFNVPGYEYLSLKAKESDDVRTITVVDCAEDVTEVAFPEGVTAIGSAAFYNCAALTSIVIPESVTVIPNDCFEACAALTSVTLHDGVTTIGSEAFRDCASLASITLPDNMTSIDARAFYNSPTIAYARLGTPTADALAAAGVKFTVPDYPDLILKGSKSSDGVISYAVVGCNPEAVSVTIPDMVTKIDDYAFRDCASLSSVTFPDGLTSIGYGAFMNCTSLKEVTLPDNITYFGDSIFAGASPRIYANTDSATAVALPYAYTTPEAPELSLSTYISQDGVRTTRVTACSKDVTKVVVPEGVTTIDHYVFQNCSKLTSISLPDTLTSIGTQVFYRCTALTSVTIPGSLTSVGSWAFAECTSLTSVTIEEGVTGIEYNAFGDCTSLTTLSLPKSLTTIGEKAFQDCTGLTTIKFSEGLTTIGKDAFNDCDNLIVVDLPEGLTTIDESAFYHCSNLVRVSLPDSLTTIGVSAFQNCVRLSSVNFPDGLTKIGQWAFAGCKGLTSFTIPGGVETIESATFHDTENLTTVTIAEGVKNINFSAFEFSYVDEVYIPNSVGYINAEAFFGCNMTIYCYEYSYAESWAKEHNYKYVLLDGKNASDYVTVSLPENTIVSMGIPVRLDAEIFPSSDSQKVSWKSSNTAVAKVSADGVVTPVKAGTATITLTVDGTSATGKVTVAPAITELSLPATVYAIARETTQIPLTILPANAARDFEYVISDTTYAKIDENGLITASAVGTTQIRVIERVSGRILRADLCITYPVSEVSFASAAVNVPVGARMQLTANVTMRTDSCVNQLVTFTSSDEKVAKVDQNGYVTGVGKGTATITATAESGVSASCKVTITDHSVPTLPAGLKAVEDEAFMGSAIDYVSLPKGCTTIGVRAFAQCARLTTIFMPDTVKSIADDAFEGSNNVCFVCESKNYAYEYAVRNGIECRIQ